MDNYRGIALISVLFFLIILSAMGLYCLQMALIETKQSKAYYFKQHMEVLAENVHQQIEKKLNDQVQHCLISTVSTEELLSRPLNWWNASACRGSLENLTYYSVIEFLCVDPCAIIQSIPKKIVANYFRISTLFISKDSKFLLQSSFITPNLDDSLKCGTQYHKTTMGRRMLREINY